MALSLVSARALDPTLASLFSSTAGPTSQPLLRKQRKIDRDHKNQSRLDEANSLSPAQDSDASSTAPVHARKRRRRGDDDDLEGAHLQKIARLDDKERTRRETEEGRERFNTNRTTSPDAHSDDDVPLDIPLHETLSSAYKDDANSAEKDSRTVFFSNVSHQAITSKSSKKILLSHVSSFLPSLDTGDVGIPHKVSSFRFRSTAYSSQAQPKRASFAKQEVMPMTTSSTNFYVVYSTALAAEVAVKSLNGTVCLDRHLHADSVSNPARPDHRRCVFVGNLDFVDDPSNIRQASQEEGQKPKKSKPAADVEEGLWRQFGKAGVVESVRVIRDQKTRVGKGFAYVQFKDVNAVEAALLFNDKKFPPMLPRQLRVVRAKNLSKKPGDSYRDRAVADRPRSDSRTHRQGARNSDRQQGRKSSGERKATGANRIVFEGHRASSNNKVKLKPMRKGGSSKAKAKPKNHSSRRTAAWQDSGKKKSRTE
ncbi:MAG: Nucleolar protein 12 [Vezdaea aestivalis]|nr:MAG: Nucleolar protein 12 [Vezdaea aestivalis]